MVDSLSSYHRDSGFPSIFTFLTPSYMPIPFRMLDGSSVSLVYIPEPYCTVDQVFNLLRTSRLARQLMLEFWRKWVQEGSSYSDEQDIREQLLLFDKNVSTLSDLRIGYKYSSLHHPAWLPRQHNSTNRLSQPILRHYTF